MRNRKRGFFRDNRGLVTMEFVIILPMILAAMFLVYELGRALLAFEIMTQDVRSSIRYLSRVENVDFTNSTDPGIVAAENMAETGDPSATPSCPASYPSSSSTNCHYPWTSGSSIKISTTAFSNTNYNVNGTVVTMTATVPMTLSFLSFIGVPTAYTLSVSNTSQYIGD